MIIEVTHPEIGTRIVDVNDEWLTSNWKEENLSHKAREIAFCYVFKRHPVVNELYDHTKLFKIGDVLSYDKCEIIHSHVLRRDLL